MHFYYLISFWLWY